jgi:hypothetical protein
LAEGKFFMPSLFAPLAPLLAVGAALAVIANFSFQGIATNSAVLPASGVGLLVAFITAARSTWREWLPVALVFVLPALHLMSAAILRDADLARPLLHLHP